jgi:predicted ATP-dependent protease
VEKVKFFPHQNWNYHTIVEEKTGFQCLQQREIACVKGEKNEDIRDSKQQNENMPKIAHRVVIVGNKGRR